jgi:Right handed beta helix region
MIFRPKEAIGACILASALMLTVTASGATFYVATTGSNSNPGTEDHPFLTIAHAVDTMVAGDTTYVRGGTYNEPGVRFRRSGTSAAPIRLLNYPNESPILSCTANNLEANSFLFYNASGWRVAIGWITLEGFEITNCYDGIKAFNIHDSTFRLNWIHHNRNQGFLGINGTRVVFDRNIVNHNGDFAGCTACDKQHGIYANGTAWTVTNNLIYGNLGYGIQLNGSSSSIYDPSKHAGPEFANSHNWIIANNTIAYNHNRGGLVIWGSTCLNVRIENNIFYENAVTRFTSAANGIDFVSATSATDIQIRNNLFYASGSGGTRAWSTGALMEGVNYSQSGNIINVSAPGFVNAGATLPPSPNFSLTARSPSIDAGRSLDMTKMAIDGTTRPQGRAYDIGAYEYTPDADAKSPSAPRALQLR